MRASLSISYVEESALVLCSNICGQYNDGFIVLGMVWPTFCLTTRTLLKKLQVSLAWRLPVDIKEMKGRLILHEKWFSRYKFFTSYLMDGRAFLRIFTFYVVFDDDWERAYRYTKINSREFHQCQSPKTWWTWRVISTITENKPHANHKTHLHAMKAYNTGPVYSLTKEIFNEVFICSKVINAFKR